MIPAIACLDVGSHSNTGWALLAHDSPITGTDIEELGRVLSEGLNAGTPLALGFECPLYVPTRSKPEDLLKQREGEGGKPWSANAGCTSLVAGLAQINWILRHLQKSVPNLFGSTRWRDLETGSVKLFLWEAFISKGGSAVVLPNSILERNEHERDAACAVYALRDQFSQCQTPSSAFIDSSVFSLVGAQLLAAGLTSDVALLSEPCLVIRARKPGKVNVKLANAQSVWSEIDSRDYQYPKPQAWDRVYSQLVALWHLHSTGREKPPTLLILGGARFTSAKDRADQWTETLVWAKRFGVDPRLLVLEDNEKVRS